MAAVAPPPDSATAILTKVLHNYLQVTPVESDQPESEPAGQWCAGSQREEGVGNGAQ